MRGWPIAVVGAAALGLVVLGLMEHSGREGPIDGPLAAVQVPVRAVGLFAASSGNDPVFGVCVEPPCQPWTTLSVELAGLPPGAYTARLAGWPAADPGLDLGPLRSSPSGHRIDWNDTADHGESDRLVISLAGRDVAVVPLPAQPGPGPGARFEVQVMASWPGPTGSARLVEVGGLVISATATVTVDDIAPHGWVYEAWLVGDEGLVAFGPLQAQDGRSVLEARVERVALEEHDRLLVTLRPAEAVGGGGSSGSGGSAGSGGGGGSQAPVGFPVLELPF